MAAVILITVLELKLPEELDDVHLLGLLPVVFSYALSFVVIAIMWANHHRLLHEAVQATPAVAGANTLLLFFMSFIPFTTSLLSGGPARPLACALYGSVLTACGFAFLLLRRAVVAQLGGGDARALRRSASGCALYAASVPLAYLSPWLSLAVFVVVPAMFVGAVLAAARTGDGG